MLRALATGAASLPAAHGDPGATGAAAGKPRNGRRATGEGWYPAPIVDPKLGCEGGRHCGGTVNSRAHGSSTPADGSRGGLRRDEAPPPPSLLQAEALPRRALRARRAGVYYIITGATIYGEPII